MIFESLKKENTNCDFISILNDFLCPSLVSKYILGSFSQLKETLNSPFSSVLCFFLFCLRNRERKGRRQTHGDTEKLESKREGERLLLSSFFFSFFFFFCFFPPQNQALILGSDSAKLISGRE